MKLMNFGDFERVKADDASSAEEDLSRENGEPTKETAGGMVVVEEQETTGNVLNLPVRLYTAGKAAMSATNLITSWQRRTMKRVSEQPRKP